MSAIPPGWDPIHAGASPYGVMDMGGNVFEWIHDYYDQDYYAVSPRRNPQGSETESWHVIRGGSYRPRIHYNRIAYRHFGHHGDADFATIRSAFAVHRALQSNRDDRGILSASRAAYADTDQTSDPGAMAYPVGQGDQGQLASSLSWPAPRSPGFSTRSTES